MNSIDLVVETLDKKLNLKKFFGEITINEDGNAIVVHVS